MHSNKVAFRLIFASLIILIAGLFFGVIGSLQYIMPDYLSQLLSFYKTRPLHVMLVITWVLNAAAAGIYYYLPEAVNKSFFSIMLANIHFFLFLFNTNIIEACHKQGNFKEENTRNIHPFSQYL